MKPAPFTYHLAHDVAEAIALLAELGEDAKVLAGGQSLVPMMNLRLARPSALVDITRIPGLSYLRAGEGGVSAAGAALASAVRDALGLAGSVGRLPLTAARVQALAGTTRDPETSSTSWTSRVSEHLTGP